VLVALLGLSACTGESPAPASSAPPADTGATTAPPTAAAPVTLVSDGSAADNLPYFSRIVADVWAGPDNVAGRSYIDALTAAGFDKSAMQVTQDESTIGNPAESIEFSVRWGDQCLVGQVGPSIGSPVSTVLPGLAGGGCLIGNTRAIDW